MQADAADGSVDWKNQAKGVFNDIKVSLFCAAHTLEDIKCALAFCSPSATWKIVLQVLAALFVYKLLPKMYAEAKYLVAARNKWQ